MGLGRGGGGAGVSLVDGLLGGEKSGADDLAVHHLGALGLGQHEPHNGERLDSVVPGNVVEDDAREGLEEGEHAEDDPVGEPLDVILGLGALERLEREVGGDEEADEVGQEASGTGFEVKDEQTDNKERQSVYGPREKNGSYAHPSPPPEKSQERCRKEENLLF